MADKETQSVRSSTSGRERPGNELDYADDSKPRLLGIDPAEERRVVRKLDFCILPIMTMFYLLSFLASLSHTFPILSALT